MNSDELLHAARRTIEAAELTAIEHLQLGTFLIHTCSREDTLRFILKAAKEPGKSVGENLKFVKQAFREIAKRLLPEDPILTPETQTALWERESGRCCVSGWKHDLQPTYIVPPSIVDDEDLLPGGALRPYLEATVSAGHVEKLFSFLKCRTQEHELKNLWLMCQPVREAFLDGRMLVKKISFDPRSRAYWTIREHMLNETPIDGLTDERFYTTPSSPDEERLPLPEAFLLDIQRTFAFLRFFQRLEDRIEHGWPPPTLKGPSLGRVGLYALRSLLCIVPVFLRLALFHRFVKSRDLNIPSEGAHVEFLPLGLCLKFGGRVSRNEANALLLIEKYTTVPAPRLVTFVQEESGIGFLLMTEVPGVSADSNFYLMTYEEREQLARDIGKCIAQYRRIQNRNRILICDTIGGPVPDRRTDDKPRGPFSSKVAFLDDQTEGLEDYRRKEPLSFLYEKDHEIVFTHSDLHRSNIFLQSGRLSGIIDWENAGFKPEYFEYTRALLLYRDDPRYAGQLKLAFDKDYEDEFEAEKLLWRLKPGYMYR